MKMQASLEFLLIGSAVAAMSLFLIGFYSRNLFSQTSALASVADMPQNTSGYTQDFFLFNYSAPTTTIAYSYRATITDRSERLSYALSPPSYVANLTQFSHCAGVGFFGHAFNVTDQCGTSNSWEYLAGYDCPRSGAYCIIPHNTTYAAQEPAGSMSYAYSFALSLSLPGGVAESHVNSSSAASQLLLNGQAIGSVSVEGVSGTDTRPEVTLMSHGGNYTLANETYYSMYTQDKNTLYPMLAFYNGTGVDGATQESIEQSIGAFAQAQTRLVESVGSAPECAVSSGSYVCNATSPFTYLINVTLSPGSGQVNQTLYYLGSVISIRG